MKLKDTEVLVTGAGGFIGSHLVARLADLGARVRAMVRYTSRGDPGNLRFLTPEQAARVEIVHGNVEDPEGVDRAVAGRSCVFHLAALIGIPYSYEAPRSYVATNVMGTLNVLEAVRRHGVERMVHTSTSEVYGTAQYAPIDEDHPLQGQSPYSASKIGADKLVESYVRSFDVPAVILRPFNTFGPRQSARAVIPAMITQLLAGRDVLELGSLDPKRDFTYVEDTAEGFIAAATRDEALGQTVQLGYGESIRVGDLAQTLCALVRPSARVVSVPERTRPENSEVMNLLSLNDRARDLLGWSPTVSLSEGLRRTIEFVRAHPEMYPTTAYTV